MSIFTRRDDWKNLLTRLNTSTLYSASHQYETMVRVLEGKLLSADGSSRDKVQAVLHDFNLELDAIRRELSRRDAMQKRNLC